MYGSIFYHSDTARSPSLLLYSASAHTRIIHGTAYEDCAILLSLSFSCILKPNPCKFFMARRCRFSCSFSFSLCSYIIISSYTLSRTWNVPTDLFVDSSRLQAVSVCVCVCVWSHLTPCVRCECLAFLFTSKNFSIIFTNIRSYLCINNVKTFYYEPLNYPPIYVRYMCSVSLCLCVYHDVCVRVYLLYKMQKIGLVESIDFHSLSFSALQSRALTLHCLSGSRKLIFTQIYITMGSVEDFLCSKSRI